MVDFKKYGIVPFGALPTERQLNHFYIGKKAFFHFGVNTFSELEWGNGNENESSFDPSELDIRQWIRSIKAAGFKLAIITAKHHDGFCLWPSKYTEHSVKNSPYKNGKGDVIREFTDACREYGMKIGLYISPWDKNSKYWGKAEYSDYYALQLTELVTEYGKIDEIWWDGAGSADTVYDWGHWAYIVREHQPDAAIFGSMGAYEYIDMRWVGNEQGYAGETNFSCIEREIIKAEIRDILNQGQAGASCFVPSETDVSIRPGWFYHKDQDEKVKSVSHINKIWFESVGRNSMMLLNFPPDRRGLLCDKDVENAILSHRCISKMLAVNFARGADITASSVLCPECSPEKAVFDESELFYASKEDTCSIDIVLPKAERINVLALGELIEAGERITGFKIEDLSDGEPSLLYEGTSVGFYKAVKIPEGYYKHLRLTVTAAFAPPVIRTLGLHLFEDVENENERALKGENLASLSTASVEYSNENKTAVVAFGGIYPFDTVEFSLTEDGEFEIESFSGQCFQPAARGKTENGRACVNTPNSVCGSYQIRIKASAPIDTEKTITVKLAK
ncbi:MAG: alpha-L-fucosidase [Clostridia bacterium]|nr:alpha-L-fucosidase [Clostridia bacterium]